jgi:hypothetical protein
MRGIFLPRHCPAQEIQTYLFQSCFSPDSSDNAGKSITGDATPRLQTSGQVSVKGLDVGEQRSRKPVKEISSNLFDGFGRVSNGMHTAAEQQ